MKQVQENLICEEGGAEAEAGDAPAAYKSTKEKRAEQAKEFNFNKKEGMQGGYALKRGCTDIPCLLIFFVFLGVFGWATFTGFKDGQLYKLIGGVDGDGKICGYVDSKGDTARKDYPVLYLPQLNINPKKTFENGVCLKECPSLKDGETKGDKRVMDCVKRTETNAMSDCNMIVYNTFQIGGYCLPASQEALPDSFKESYQAARAYFAQGDLTKYLNDIIVMKLSIEITAVMGVVWCFLFIGLMSAFAEYIAWFCVILTGLGLMAGWGGMYYAKVSARSSHEELIATDNYKNNVSEADKANQTKTYDKWQKRYFWGLVILAVMNVCFCCCLFYTFRSLREAIDTIDASSDFLFETKRVIAIPVIYFLLQAIWVVVWFCCFLCVISTNTIEPSLMQTKKITYKADGKYWMWFMVFGGYWVMQYISYTGDFIVLDAVAYYYFDHNPENGREGGKANIMNGVKHAHINHAGSIGIASFIMAVIKMIKFLFGYLAERLKKMAGPDQGGVVKCIVGCGTCCVACLEKIGDYINHSAMAYMATTGEGFINSAWGALMLQLKHMAAFAWSGYIAACFIWLGKVALTVANCFFFQLVVKIGLDDQTDETSMMGPVVAVGLITYLTANIFLGLFDEAVLSMMTARSIDLDITGGDETSYGPKTFEGKLSNPKSKRGKGDAGKGENKVEEGGDFDYWVRV